MTDVVREVVTTQENAKSAAREASSMQTVQYLIYFLFGILETLLAFRFFFKLAGASLSSNFVTWVYGITGMFIMPFEGIFRRATMSGAETTSIFEPATLLSLAIYALIGWAIVKLVAILSGEKQDLS